jgi:lactoylglutathione lyase
LGGAVGPRYRNPRTGFESYFVSFAGDVRLELMTRPDVVGAADASPKTGYAHVALAAGSREAVDTLVAELRQRGVPVTGEPRLTGDGFYEAVVADPDGNVVEIIA